MEINILKLLDKLDEFRRNHQNQAKDPSDYCMRVMEAIIAREAGYKSRSDWTDALRNTPETRYSRDLKDSPAKF